MAGRDRPTRSARGTSMGATSDPAARTRGGLNPVAGMSVSLEDAAALPIGGVTATVQALEDADPAGPRGVPQRNLDAASPAAAGEVRGRHPLHHALGVRAEGRPADGDPRTRRRHRRRRAHPGAARRHRLRQDLHHGQGDRGDQPSRAHPRPEQDARGAALRRVQVVLPGQRGRVFRLLLRLLPARGLRAADGHLHREGILDQRADRPHAPLGHPLAARARRRDHRRLGLLHLRYRLGRDLYRDDLLAGDRRADQPAPAARRPRGAAVQAPGHRLHARHLPRPRRHGRGLPGPS